MVMALMQLDNVCQCYGRQQILKKVSLTVKRGEILALIGPTGAGKTSLLRILDLLDKPSSGKVYFAGREISKSPKLTLQTRRKMAMMFQKPIVFNSSVYNNIAYPLKIRGYKKRKISKKVNRMLSTVGLDGYQRRNARTLSGGETQRLALARALIANPEILLLDEPTANLDPAGVSLIEELIRDCNYNKGITVIMATHDMSQGERLASRMGVLMGGKLVQVGTSREVFNTPRNIKIARLTEMENVLKGVISSSRDGIIQININGEIVEGVSNYPVGEEVFVCIRPEDITLSLSRASTSARNFFVARINQLTFSGPLVRVELGCRLSLTVLVTKKSVGELRLEIGKKVYASFKATGVHIIPAESK